MRERLQYDPHTNILELDFSYLTIQKVQQLEEIRELLREALNPLQHKVYALVNYEGFMVEDELKEAYSLLIRELYNTYSLGTFRYSSNVYTRMAIQEASCRQGMASRTYNSRQEAIQAISRLKEAEE